MPDRESHTPNKTHQHHNTDNLYFSVIANLSIASLNVSLLVNSVGFYQIAKLLIIPFVAVMELLWFRRRFTPEVVASMVVVVIGVSIV
jgi:solute carrier family 35 protein E3